VFEPTRLELLCIDKIELRGDGAPVVTASFRYPPDIDPVTDFFDAVMAMLLATNAHLKRSGET
jgi:hypothetical protein